MYRAAEPKPVIRRMAEELGAHHEALHSWIRQASTDVRPSPPQKTRRHRHPRPRHRRRDPHSGTSGREGDPHRVLAEITDTDPHTAPATARELLDQLIPHVTAPILLHGEDSGAWPVLNTAVQRGLPTRIGLEDVLHAPDGTPTHDNVTLVRFARLARPGSPGRLG
ncbi:3-keto-5-aminohexanoate cleavage protein [Streptomyces olivoreticuli]|uniref:3-keto-5-aminohexanoate cleavage protein n=1 Tax=Streptomyces olivoreticuli TaxID=68246 RepID=UPI003CC7D09C